MTNEEKLQTFLGQKGNLRQFKRKNFYYCIAEIEELSYRGKGSTEHEAINACWNQVSFLITEKRQKLQNKMNSLQVDSNASRETIMKAKKELTQFINSLGYLVE